MTCDHINNRVFTKRIFGNMSEHYCIQCLNCGSVVKCEGKLWLKLSDIPEGKTVYPFDEILNDKGPQL